MKKDNKLNSLVLCVVVALGVIVLAICVYFKGATVKENVYYRDIKPISFLINKEPKVKKDGVKTGRNVAWDSELPKFVKRDLKYAKKKGYNIEYQFKEYTLYINFNEEDEPVLSFNSSVDTSVSIYGDVTNFSMYKNTDNDLVIYGYTNHGKSFGYMILGKDEYTYWKVLAFNSDIPFDVEYYGNEYAGTKTVGDYGIYLNLDENDNYYTIYFYQDGKLISQNTLEEPVNTLNHYNGTILTETRDVYLALAVLDNSGKPEIKYVCVGKADKLISTVTILTSIVSDDVELQLPILISNDEYYTVSAENWNAYKNSSIGSKNALKNSGIKPDFNVKLVKLTDSFTSATFEYDDMSRQWSATINFTINGLNATYDYMVNGYDNSVKISDIDSKALRKTVYSVDGFWNNIYSIRDVYAKNYDYPLEKSLK